MIGIRTKWPAIGAILLVISGPIQAQVEVHGEVYPLARLTLNEHRFLSLPQRLVAVDVSKYGDRVGLHFAMAAETRMADSDVTLDLREAYIEYQTNFGDVRFGKQIHAWGAVDGNNPTDNVTPYDFYYLFFPGTDRKRGNVTASSNIYLGSSQMEVIFTPIFTPNRVPIGDPDMPIGGGDISVAMLPHEILPERDLEHAEYGVRLSRSIGSADVSLSYFSGNDRMFTVHPLPASGIPDPNFVPYRAYHRTNVVGGDIVWYLGDWGFRGEAAYFMTEDADGTDGFIRNPYLQYVAQIERTADDVTLSGSYIGTVVTKIDDDSWVDNPDPTSSVAVISERVNETDLIGAKMGMPFAAIAQNAIMAVAKYSFLDQQYELGAQVLYDLDNSGYMIGGHLTITLEDAFDLELAVSSFGGDEDSKLHELEDFGHISAALKYSF
ncbi:DUF1302 family protein [Candidatus Neomarinimicrobiota bacterium]